MHERQVATLRELEEYYGLDDLHDMHAALDVLDALKQKQVDAMNEAQAQANNRRG